MRGLGKLGRLAASLLLAAGGMTVITTTSAATVTYPPPGEPVTNIQATVTSQDAYTATGTAPNLVYGDAYFTFSFTRTSSTSLNNGQFVFFLTDTTAAGSIQSVTPSPSVGATCGPILATSFTCTITSDVPTVAFTVVVKPTAAQFSYRWAVRPGSGTSSPDWLGDTKTLAAGGDLVAGAAGTATVTANTTIDNFLQGYLTAKGKTGADAPVIYVGVKEFTGTTITNPDDQCNNTRPYIFCVGFSAVNSSGAKVFYPTDLADLLNFAVYVVPSNFAQLATKSIQQVTLWYSADANDSNPVQISNCPSYRSMLRTPPPIPCIEKRTALNAKSAAIFGVPEGTWQFLLYGQSNGFVQVFD